MTNSSRNILKENRKRYNIKQKEQCITNKIKARNIFIVIISYLGIITAVAFDKNQYSSTYFSTFLALLSLAIIFIFETAEWMNFKNKKPIKTPVLFSVFFITFIIIGIAMKNFLFNTKICENVPNVIACFSMIIYIISVYSRYLSELKKDYKKHSE